MIRTKRLVKAKVKTRGLKTSKSRNHLNSNKERIVYAEKDLPIQELELICERSPIKRIPFFAKNGGTYPYELILYPMITSCGFACLRNNINLIYASKEKLAEIKADLLKFKTSERYGAIIATLGDGQLASEKIDPEKYNYTEILEFLGFKKLIDYNNPVHGTTHRQHLYIHI